jgi:hypothetical protein
MPLRGILCWTGRLAVSFMVALLLFPIWHVVFTLTIRAGQIRELGNDVAAEWGLFFWIVAATFLALYFGRSVRFHVLFLHGLATLVLAWWVSAQTFDFMVGALSDMMNYPRHPRLRIDVGFLTLNTLIGTVLLILIAEILILAALVTDARRVGGLIRGQRKSSLE